MININPYRFALGGQTPSLDLQFVNQNLTNVTTGTSPVTFTRASTGTFIGSNGSLQTAATNAPRFDCNPLTGACLGLLIEEARTNSIRNNTMVGAVAGTPGTLPTNWSATTPANGITREIVGTGTEDGIAYIDFRFYGTNTLGSAFYMDISLDSGTITAAQGQTWTESIYARLVAGSVSGASFTTGVRMLLYETPNFASSQLLLTAVSSAKLGSQRFAVSRTLTDVTTTGVSPRIAWNVATGATIDFTLRIGLPQMEQGAFASSVIPTTTAAATRSADVASITGTAFTSFYNQTEGSFFCSTFAPKSGVVYGTGDTFDNTQYVTVGTTNNVFIRSGAALVAFLTAPVSTTALTNIAHGYAVDNFVAVSNGGAVSTDTSGAVPLAQVRLSIGGQPWVVGDNSVRQQWVRRLTYWPTRLPNAVLQQITT